MYTIMYTSKQKCMQVYGNVYNNVHKSVYLYTKCMQYKITHLAQLEEQQISTLSVGGSNPSLGVK